MPEMWGGRADTGSHSEKVRRVKVRTVKDKRGKRDWTRENGMRWDSWDALASKKWVRIEDSDRVDDEGRPILERVDLMEAFFPIRSRNQGSVSEAGALVSFPAAY